MYIPGRVAGKQAHPGGAGNLDNNSSREKKITLQDYIQINRVSSSRKNTSFEQEI